MAKFIHDDVLDALLNEIADNGNKLFICNAQPTTYTQASTTYALADHDLVVGDGNGDYTMGDGDASGRKLSLAAQSGITVDTSGTATYAAICDSANQKVLAVTTITSQSITAGNTMTLNALDIVEVADPA